MIIPVITGATGKVTKNLEKNSEAVPGKHSKYSVQMTATVGTSQITGKYCRLKLEA
jgi:hypothetical protein